MKICRYLMREASSSDTASPHYGLIEGENVIEISGPPWGQWSRGSRSSRLADARLLAPVEPTKIVCIGRNYAAHAAEMGNEVPKEPLMFLKPPSSIIGPEEAIVLTKYSQRVEHEGELAMVIGRRCSQFAIPTMLCPLWWVTPASTMLPRATCRKATCNSLAARVSIPFAPSARTSKPLSIHLMSWSRLTSTGRAASPASPR